MSNSERKAIVNALQRNLKQKSAENYEKQIYRMCKRVIKDDPDGNTSIDMLYAKIAYEKVGQLILCEDRSEREKILADIKNQCIGFESSVNDDFRRKQKKECSFTAKGPKVEKGEFPCRNSKCRSKECFFYTLQTRSLDEPASIFVTCIKCKTRYKF